jgi:hypothetical protein
MPYKNVNWNQCSNQKVGVKWSVILVQGFQLHKIEWFSVLLGTIQMLPWRYVLDAGEYVGTVALVCGLQYNENPLSIGLSITDNYLYFQC